MNDPKHPIPGDLHIDATDVDVTDITPEEINKLTKVRDGFEAAVANVVNLKPEDLDRAGLNEKEIKRLALAFQKDQRIAELLPAAEKLAELLYETKQSGRHEIGTLLAETAAQARRRADRATDGAKILGPLSVLMDYQYGPGAKASATKEKAKDAKPEGGAPPGGTP